jgi:MFS family permease
VDRPPLVAEASRARLLQLCTAGALAYCSYAICRSPLLPLFARELGADAPMIGVIVGASTLTGVVLKLPAGAWSDVLGRRALLVAGALVFAVMPFTYLAVSGVALLIVLRALHGSATAIFSSVASATLSDIAPPLRRATWLSTYSTIQGAGQAVGPVIAGYMIARRRYDLAFVVAGVIGLSVPILAWRWPTTPRRFRTERLALWPQFVRGILDVIRERLVLVASLAQAAHFLLNGSLSAFFPLYASEVIRMSAVDIGWMFAVQTVTTLAARPAIGILSDRVGRRSVITTGLVACSAAVAMISFARSPGSLFVAVLVYAAGVAITTSATSAFVTDVAPRARYGAAHGVSGTLYDVADAAGPLVAGLLVGAWGYEAMFRTMAAAATLMGLMFYWVSRPAVR